MYDLEKDLLAFIDFKSKHKDSKKYKGKYLLYADGQRIRSRGNLRSLSQIALRTYGEDNYSIFAFDVPTHYSHKKNREKSKKAAENKDRMGGEKTSSPKVRRLAIEYIIYDE